MTNLPPSRTADRIIVRLPDGMRDRLAAEASVRGQSVTAFVVEVLERALSDGSEYSLAVLMSEMNRVMRDRDSHQKAAQELGEYLSHLQAERRAIEEGLRARGVEPDRMNAAAAVRKLSESAVVERKNTEWASEVRKKRGLPPEDTPR
ncbi:Arc family DNA-binding protein [Sphingomonas aquatilis]